MIRMSTTSTQPKREEDSFIMNNIDDMYPGQQLQLCQPILPSNTSSTLTSTFSTNNNNNNNNNNNAKRHPNHNMNKHKNQRTTKIKGIHDPNLINNPDSSRAKSRKHRVYVFYDFLKEMYPYLLNDNFDDDNNNDDDNDSMDHHHNINGNEKVIILDIAGGKGDLSWLLSNLHHSKIQSITIDPRYFSGDTNQNMTNNNNNNINNEYKSDNKIKYNIQQSNHKSIIKSIEFLNNNPEVIPLRNKLGTMSYQPLAALYPSLMKCREEIKEERIQKQIIERQKCDNIVDENCAYDEWIHPKSMKIYFDDILVQTMKQMKEYCNNSIESNDNSKIDGNHPIWLEYWNNANQKLMLSSSLNTVRSHIITSPHKAYDYISKCQLIVGFHPDQATEAIIDLALLLKVSFCVVPCCVYAKEFPNRFVYRNSNNNDDKGVFVRDYDTLIEYLRAKDKRIRVAELEFQYTETARKVVLYMLPEDFL